ncbi:hypothetical protein BDZ91DRAFT_720436 [Kalaharituber pfeilii]|nr:hypothetical protein BDZ91DRAFT_720436 [Kalaharituber pfeilii]
MPDPERRTPLHRSTTAPASSALQYMAGDIPPELSPLDELAIRGRILRKQLGTNEGRAGLTPQSIHRSLRRPERSPGLIAPGFLERSFSLDSQQHNFGGRVGGMGVQFTATNEDERPVSSYPRFSNVSIASSFRDSNASVITLRPDQESSPNLQENPDRHNAIHAFDFGGRESLKPAIVSYEGGNGDESPVSPTSQEDDVGRELGTKKSEDDQVGPLTPVMRPAPRDGSVSPGSRAPQPQGTTTYQAYNPNIHGPRRQASRESENGRLRAPIPRKGSRDSSRGRSPHSPLLRSGSSSSTNNTNDTSNEVPNSIFPMLDTIRAASPEDMGDVPLTPNAPLSSPPVPSMSQQVRQDNYDWLHDFQGSTGPSTPRPPSAGSQRSVSTTGGTKHTSKAINFSRPLLNAQPSIDISAANETFLRSPNLDDSTPVHTPIGVAETHDGEAITSYTYAKFYLPRGRAVDRNSLIFLDNPPVSEGQEQQQQPQPQPQLQQLQQQQPQQQQQRKPSYTAYSPSVPVTPLTRSPTQPGDAQSKQPPSDYVSMVLRQQSQQKIQRPQTAFPLSAPRSPHLSHPGSVSPNPNKGLSGTLQPPKTPRPSPSKENMAPASTMTPEEHVTLGIECHENGSLQQSSYHLRIAANAGHPTGMLLYALSLRHGWGMKPNPQEAIVWLKKVMQVAGGAAGENDVHVGASDFFEKQGRKAQFALSVYELGMCHLNGWGTEVDKAYALKCFKLAGKLGDADALSEAGYCYYHGVGTKKDLKKSAKYYRMAEAKGVNMVGNSWIWKDKYLDDEDRREKAKKEGKPEPASEKSGGGGFFNRKKH